MRSSTEQTSRAVVKASAFISSQKFGQNCQMTTVSWIFVGLFFICQYHEISPSKCLRHQFRCSDHQQCIPLHRRCDRHVDCDDGSDEADCTADATFRCPRGDHRCGNSRCLPEMWVCDGKPNCEDSSDEGNCDPVTSKVCLKNEFPCTNWTCLPMSKRCDGVPGDCPDKISDEFQCDARRCPGPEHHRCGSGLCLSPTLVCDGEVQCNDGSDEENCRTCETWGCSHYCVEGSHGPRCFCEKGYQLSTQDERTCMATCLRNEFRCSDGEQCVRALQRCDGEDNCRDKSDEHGCRDFACPEYRCANRRQCFPESYVCDGWRDCDDGSDEKDCAPVPFSGSPEFGSCLRNQFRCPDGPCIPLRWRCDGEPDCSGDEVDCGSRVCPAGQHRCRSNGQCIPGLLACDRVLDCADGSDEENCDACESWGCSQICKETSLGPRCFCEEGFKLDAQDERTCKGPKTKAVAPACPPFFYLCGTGHCVYRKYVCDGSRECPDGSDEADCAPLPDGTCPTGRSLCKRDVSDRRRYCVPMSFLCDGMRDCAHPFNDEAGCDASRGANVAVTRSPLLKRTVLFRNELSSSFPQN